MDGDHPYFDPCQPPRAKKRKLGYNNSYDLSLFVTTSFMDNVFEYVEILCKHLVNPANRSPELILNNQFNNMLEAVGEAKSLEDIVNACNEHEMLYERDIYGELVSVKGIRGVICSNTTKKCGRFLITLEECFETGSKGQQILSPMFRKTKDHIKTYLLSEIHGNNAAAQNQLATEIAATKGYVQSKLEEISTRLLVSNVNNSNVVVVPEQANNQISSAKSIQEILDFSPYLQLHLPSEERRLNGDFDGLMCVPCHDKQRLKNAQTQAGLFSYDKSEPKPKNQNRQLERDSHLKVVQNTQHENSVDPKKQMETEKIGMALGKLAYDSVVRHCSKIGYETSVAIVGDFGFPVGDINHGVEFVDKMIPIFYQVLKEQTITVLNSGMKYSNNLSPFVIFAYKVTPNCTTLQIIGIITLQQGKNTPLLLDITPVRHHDGRSIAQDIVNSILRYYTPAQAQNLYMGSSYDGQYINLGVPNHVLNLLGIEYPDDLTKEQQSQPFFHSVSWDPGGKKYKWLQSTENAIVNVNRKNTYGKNFQTLVDEVANIDPLIQKTLLRPGSFSETRFSSYKHMVLYRFNNNFPSLYNKLAKERDDDLNLISSAMFCLRLCAMQDIFELIGITSKTVQSSSSFPWECDAAIEKFLQSLSTMVGTLTSSEALNKLALPKFSEAVEEKRSTYTTRSYSTQTQDDVSFDIIIANVKEEVAIYVSNLIESIEERFARNFKQKVFFVARKAFSLQNILSRKPDEVPEAFVEYCTLGKNIGLFQEPSFSSLDSQYKVIATSVHDLHAKLKLDNSEIDENTFYEKLLTSIDNFYTSPDIVFILASALVRNRSECVAESLGSLIKLHLEKRCSLSNQNLEKELIRRLSLITPK